VTPVRLRLLGEEHAFAVDVPGGPCRLTEVLPAARALDDAATALLVARSTAEGRPPTCRAGCSACCRHLVAVSLVEARDLADLVAALPLERREAIRARFAAALRRLEKAGLLERGPRSGRALLGPACDDPGETAREVSRLYFRARAPCPFLEEDRCSIYERRPMVCREHFVTSPPEECSRPGKGRVVPVGERLGMTAALARVAGPVDGRPARTIPLVLALEWAEAHGATLDEERDGAEMIQRLAGEQRRAT
jgi:Fe-S-cluster containining protein